MAFTPRSAPTSRGLSIRISIPVRTPGPTTTTVPSVNSASTGRIAETAVGTTLERAAPRRGSGIPDSSPVIRMRYSSAVREMSVEIRQRWSKQWPR